MISRGKNGESHNAQQCRIFVPPHSVSAVKQLPLYQYYYLCKQIARKSYPQFYFTFIVFCFLIFSRTLAQRFFAIILKCLFPWIFLVLFPPFVPSFERYSLILFSISEWYYKLIDYVKYLEHYILQFYFINKILLLFTCFCMSFSFILDIS